MFAKILKTKFRNRPINVLVFFEKENDSGESEVMIRSMLNEYFLIEVVKFQSRDAAYDFIKHYPVEMAREFVLRAGAENSAYES